MAVDNTAIGSALIIPDSLLKNLGEVDKKIKDIQDTSKQTAQVFNSQFASMSLNTGNLLNNLQQVINQLGSVGQAAQTASSATQNMGSGLGTAAQGATNFGTSVTGVVEAINRMIGQLQQTGQVGSSSLMAAKLAADKLMEAMKFKNTGNIAALKDEIQNINKTLKDTETALSRSEQQSLVERKRLLQEELKEAERTQNERAVNLQRVLDRMMRAEQSYQRQVEQSRKKTAQDYQKQNYASNTTYSGSLSFADNANTINRRTQAIKYLTEARNALSKTDADYTNKLATLNAKIKELNAANRQAIASSQELNNNHRNLMDTAGQLQRAFALMFSVSQIRGYIGQIAKVRGEFELQQRSLEAILQNKTEADAIFNKTVALAVQSPFQIRELVSYTKQLAAYRIENDKLYDTTKRLADVSAGLGVDLGRLILAYGQVKAAAYLRGCLGYNTPIRMYDGSIKMVQDVQVGDVLINENGEKVNVKELIRGREKMYIINQLCGNDRTMYKVNANHILTLWNVAEQRLEDIYLYDYLKDPEQHYLGVKVQDNGERFYYAIEAIECGVDNYYGFVLDGNKRFLLGDGTITHNTEVRQFTEAGINMYGELQRYFQEVKGEAYTTAQIVDMISKRMVTFEDVEQIFKRITDQGGIFYRMQEIQAETLQGKISNFKDSVDVMMNEIGKDNEGLFKGAIDSATALLGHWEEIVNVGKALVGIFLLLKTQSMLTGVAMSKVFASEFYRTSTKNATSLTLLGKGFTRAQIAARNFGRSLKAAFMTNLPLAGFMLAIEIVLNLINRQNEYSKSVRETVTEYNKSIYALKELKAAYSDTANVSDNASKKELSNAENKREALEKLVEMMKKENLTIEFNVKDVSESELDKYFKDSLQRYEQFLQGKKKLDILYEKNIRDTYIVDNVKDDLKDYSNAANDLIAESDKIGEAIANLNAKYKQLPKSARIAFNELEKIKADDTNIDNIGERIKKLQTIYNSLVYFDFNKKSYQVKGDFENEANQMIGLIRLYKKAQSAKEELLTIKKVDNRYIYSGELATIANELQKQYVKAIDDGVKSGLSKAQARIQAAKDIQLQINTLQARKEIDDFGAGILRTAGDYKFVLNFDKKKAEDDVYSIKKQLDNAFANNVYTISFKLAKLDSDLGYDELDKQMQGKLKELQKLVTQRHNLEGGNYAGYDPISQNIRINELYNDIAHMGKGYKEAADHIMGYDKANKASAKSAKAQRDILSEQIEAYKDLQSQYEKYLKLYDAETAKAKALESLRYKLQNAGIYKDAAGIVPDEKTITGQIKNIASKIKNLQRRGNAYKIVADLEFQTDDEELKDKIDKVKDEIEKAFNGLALNTKLTDLGLHSYDIDKLFPGLKKSVNDVRNTIYREFSITPEMLKLDDAKLKLKMGEKLYEEYTSAINKLNQQEVEEQRRNVEQLVKDYKNQLDSQLQIDLWYAREREKIDKNISESTLRSEMYSNLEKKYKEKSDENKWKSFQNSDAYISIFGNLENASKQTLDYLYKRLEEVKSSLHNLSPEDLKEVVEAMNKINTEQVKRNPFKGLTKNIKEYIKYLKERKELEQERNSSMTKEQTLASEADRQNATVEFYEKQYELAQKLYGGKAKHNPLAKKEISDAEKRLKQAREDLQLTKEKIKLQKKVTESKNDELQKGEQAGENTKNALQDIADYASQATTAVRAIGDAFGGLSGEAEVAVDVLDNIGQAIGNFYANNYGGMVANAAGALSGIVQLFSGDIGRREQIADLSAEISKLQNAFERLEKSMNDAWSLSSLEKYKSEAVKDLELMNKKLEQMIQLERDCKNPDEGKITDMENQIQDNLDTIIELTENFREALGGLGSEANYKSAAQEFADAWFEAFNEGSNTLDALNGQFDQLIKNLVKKQIMLRVTDKFLKPIFELIDKTVSPDGNTAAGVEQLKAGLAQLNSSKDNWLEGADEYMKVLADFYGISPNADSALSALQQGIQGITEDTASALESLLNSMRFFLATQQADVAVIKDYLLSRGEVTNDSGTTSPMLTELKNQTMVLRNIHSMWERVIKPMQGGWGLRVIGIS